MFISPSNLLTPNIPEAGVLTGLSILNEEDMIHAAENISNEFAVPLLKGGHNINDANDLLYWNHKYRWFIGRELTIKILMEPDVHYPAPLLHFLLKVWIWKNQSN